MVDPEGKFDDQLSQEFGELKRRCEEAGLAYEDEVEDGERFAVITFKAGRKPQYVLVDEEDVQDMLDLNFEQYSFLGRYDAICSYVDGAVEGVLESPAGGLGNWRRLAGITDSSELPETVIDLEGPGGQRVAIGKPNKALRLLVRGNIKLAIRATGVSASTHDQAVQILEKISNSLLFDIDGRLGVPLVVRRRRVLARPHGRVSRGGGDPPERFPNSQFDPEPMSLYWYARSAARMPLLQFLAYYQILEFYFDLHFQADARLRIRNIIRDPGFDPFSDRDITRVLVASHRNAPRSAGNERSQLRSTVRGCADPDQIRDFAFSARNKKFFAKKKEGLTENVLREQMSDDELMDGVANRLYDIRCKIVHTKDAGIGEDLGLLLPFSSEAEELGRDTELLHMISRAALISGSSPLQLPVGTPTTST